jgi:hypothetical protein
VYHGVLVCVIFVDFLYNLKIAQNLKLAQDWLKSSTAAQPSFPSQTFSRLVFLSSSTATMRPRAIGTMASCLRVYLGDESKANLGMWIFPRVPRSYSCQSAAASYIATSSGCTVGDSCERCHADGIAHLSVIAVMCSTSKMRIGKAVKPASESPALKPIAAAKPAAHAAEKPIANAKPTSKAKIIATSKSAAKSASKAIAAKPGPKPASKLHATASAKPSATTTTTTSTTTETIITTTTTTA